MKEQLNSGQKSDVIRLLKEYAAPSLLAFVMFLIWRDISELRNDVKTLLAQANGDKVKIEKIETEISFLKNHIFNNKKQISLTAPVDGTSIQYPDYSVYVLKNDENYDNLIKKIENSKI